LPPPFYSDNYTLNWLYETFVHTMYCNLLTSAHPISFEAMRQDGATTVTHLWIMLLCMSAMGIVALAVFSKKKSVG
jgi:hypothetical protein